MDYDLSSFIRRLLVGGWEYQDGRTSSATADYMWSQRLSRWTMNQYIIYKCSVIYSNIFLLILLFCYRAEPPHPYKKGGVLNIRAADLLVSLEMKDSGSSCCWWLFVLIHLTDKVLSKHKEMKAHIQKNSLFIFFINHTQVRVDAIG